MALLALIALLWAGRWIWTWREVQKLRSEPARPVSQAPGLPSQPWGYEVPVRADAPWPLFRRDRRNTGRSPIAARYRGDRPWAFRTGKGIFSTPVLDGDGTAYVGSADHVFYAINPDGTERWRFRTGEIIDSAAALPRREADGRAAVLVPSGDGYLYKLWAEPGLGAQERVAWRFGARAAPRESYNDWFEANVAIGPDGTIYAGNTNFNYYAISPGGQLVWAYPTGANAWSIAGFADDGTLFWGSNDTQVRAVRPDGTERWSTRTLGFIAASAAVGSDGTLYIGSFDSYLYAIDGRTGQVRWKFKTGDHIYASAALGEDAQGRTRAIYVGSGDGIFYALDPDGKPFWQYDTGDPIRSSAALGVLPPGEGADEGRDGLGGILYFGSGNGRLYALHARDGSRRWSFDTTSSDPELADRNDLNASLALGETGVYAAGESGHVWYVPYDWCLHAADPRCATEPGEDLPRDGARLLYVTPGGTTRDAPPAVLAPASLLTLRLVVRRDGRTLDARFCNTPLWCWNDDLRVVAEPAFAFDLEKSPDGAYLHVVPKGLLEPDRAYALSVRGSWYTGGLHLGNLTVGGTRAGEIAATLRFRTAPHQAARPALAVGPERVSAFEWTRPATPIPPMLPSLNQIGFDYLDWIVGTVEVGERDARGQARVLLWAIGGRRDAQGVLVVDPKSDFLLPLSGVLRGNDFLVAREGFTVQVTGIPIPFHRFELRGRFGRGLAVLPGASLFGESEVLSIPTFGPLMVMAGLANDVWRRLVVSGTYVTRPYPDGGSANARPAGVRIGALEYQRPVAGGEGSVSFLFRREPGARYPLAEHRPGILLVDRGSGTPLPLDYAHLVEADADGNGHLARVTLAIPAGTPLPERLDAVVLLDVFPLNRTPLH